MAHIALVSNSSELERLLGTTVQELGYELRHYDRHSTECLDHSCRLIVVDGESDAPSVIESVRSIILNVPLLVLTQGSEEPQRAELLEKGADDCVEQPCSERELLARIKALLRRIEIETRIAESKGPSQQRVFERLRIDLKTRDVTYNGLQIQLTPIEYAILTFLSSSPGRPFSKAQLIEHVWGTTTPEYEHSVQTHVSRLRGKVEPDPSNPIFIQTVRGLGYRFSVPSDEK